MKRPPPLENQQWHFVLDTELSGPECRQFVLDAPTQEKAEILVAEEFGIDVCIVSCNGKMINRRPKFSAESCTKTANAPGALVQILAPPANLFEPIKTKPLEDNIEVAPYMMLPCATETKSWS